MSTLSTQLYRACLRLVFGRQHWHRRYYRPTVSVVQGSGHIWIEENGHVVEALSLAALSGRFSGRCNLWLSGPSVKMIDRPNRVAGCDWMGVNGSPKVFGDDLPPMTHYHVNDAGFIKANLDDFLRFAKHATYTIVDFRGIYELLRLAPEALNGIQFVVYDCWSYPLYLGKGKIETMATPPQLGGVAFSKDPLLGLAAGGTVAYTGAQMLIMFGYTSLYFYGLDLSDTGRAYTETVSQPQMLDKSLERVIIPAFSLLARENRALGLFNCNPESKLPAEVMDRIAPEVSLEGLDIHDPIHKN